jgi:hypothetical protein
MSQTIHALLLYAFMACTGTILMILKCHHVQEVDHLRETRPAENIVFGRCQEKANLLNVVEKGKMLL